VDSATTYLAVTFSKSQQKAFLYVYTVSRDIDYVSYELIPHPYIQAGQDLNIGIATAGPLFPPFPGVSVTLYPFAGLIGEVAIYNKILDESALRNHAINAFFNS
jgi:hypothetical protein